MSGLFMDGGSVYGTAIMVALRTINEVDVI